MCRHSELSEQMPLFSLPRYSLGAQRGPSAWESVSCPGQMRAMLHPVAERSPSECVGLRMARGHAQLGAWSDVALLGPQLAAKCVDCACWLPQIFIKGFFFFFFFFFFYGCTCSIWARGHIGAAVAGLSHSHSKVGSKLHLRAMLWLTATPDH